MKTLYISDLDGTLLTPQQKMSDYSTKAVNQFVEEGLNFTVATARNLVSVARIMKDVKLPLPIALMNGVLLYDMNSKNYVKVNKIPIKASKNMAQIFKEFNTTVFLYELDGDDFLTYHETYGSSEPKEYTRERISRYKHHSFNHQPSFNTNFENAVYFTLQDKEDNLRPIYNALKNEEGINRTFYEDVYHPGLWYLEIHSNKASKYNAVEYLKQTYSFDNVICFGDNLNDLPLFKAGNIKIAVENAHEELKNTADFICESNENDGVVKWINNCL